MSEENAMKNFDWGTVTGGGLFLKFEAGKPVNLRVLTVNPVVNTSEFEDKVTGDVTVNTKFNFIVYNWTEKKAQILSASAAMARKLGELDSDVELTGGDIKTVDIRISPTGEKLNRRYDIQVLPKANELTNDIIKECAAIKLEEVIKDGQRMSVYKPSEKSGYDKAKEARAALGVPEETPEVADEEIDEEIDLSSIPFN